MFAGPNGSGKSTLKAYLPTDLLGSYLNPDEIEQSVRDRGFLDVAQHGVVANGPEVLQFFRDSALLAEAGLTAAAHALSFSNGRLEFGRLEVNSYLAAVAVEYLSQRLLAQANSFTRETVMSHSSKVALLTQAQAAGYRTYLYFVATDDPAINISRVRNRVKLGGHAVPEGLIVKRYYKSLGLLMEAIRCTNRAYIFDNSGDNADRSHTWLAEITDGRTLELKTDLIPAWFRRAVLDQTAIRA
jgi:predicted ABC-type ATPase